MYKLLLTLVLDVLVSCLLRCLYSDTEGIRELGFASLVNFSYIYKVYVDERLGFPCGPWPDLPPTRSPIAQLVRALH